MKIQLLQATPLTVVSQAIRTCWDSHDKSDNGGDKDRELIYRVGNKYKHASTLEHCVFTFAVEGVSRALLQEVARTRIASISVKSTRYTLKKLKEEVFIGDVLLASNVSDVTNTHTHTQIEQFSQYLVWTDNPHVNQMSIKALLNLQTLLKQGISNDKAKYALPESYKTNFKWTLNLRALQHLISLRSDKSALWEYRELIKAMIEVIPKEYRYLIDEFNKGE